MSGEDRPGEPAGPGADGPTRGGVPSALYLVFDSGMLPELRLQVHAHACRAGMPGDQAAEVVLAVHELAANAIRHGRGTGRLRVWDRAGALHCQVDDGDPPGPQDPALVSWLPGLAGHGLWVARHVADQMQIASGPRGTRVTVTFHARVSGLAAAGARAQANRTHSHKPAITSLSGALPLLAQRR
jgi:anti-sigma regulatory factor (Ser/Thr protein kinase)